MRARRPQPVQGCRLRARTRHADARAGRQRHGKTSLLRILAVSRSRSADARMGRPPDPRTGDQSAPRSPYRPSERHQGRPVRDGELLVPSASPAARSMRRVARGARRTSASAVTADLPTRSCRRPEAPRRARAPRFRAQCRLWVLDEPFVALDVPRSALGEIVAATCPTAVCRADHAPGGRCAGRAHRDAGAVNAPPQSVHAARRRRHSQPSLRRPAARERRRAEVLTTLFFFVIGGEPLSARRRAGHGHAARHPPGSCGWALLASMLGCSGFSPRLRRRHAGVPCCSRRSRSAAGRRDRCSRTGSVSGLPLVIIAPLLRHPVRPARRCPGDTRPLAAARHADAVARRRHRRGAHAGLRGGGVLVSLLVLPLYIPVLIFGAGAVEAGSSGLGAAAHLSLLGAFLAVAAFFAPWATAGRCASPSSNL